MSVREVVFIAGANWSGSTLLGTVLGNSQDAFEPFHVGEAHAFFSPERPKYGQPRAAAKVTDFWGGVDYGVGPENAYHEIAEKSGCHTIVDSSKLVRWFVVQADACEAMGVELSVLVTFRAFNAFFFSAEAKRGNARDGFDILNYYARFFKIADRLGIRCAPVNMERFVREPERSTEIVCNWAGVPYFDGKSRYWEGDLFHLYGSVSQRRPLKDGETTAYKPRPERERHPLADELSEQHLENERRLFAGSLL